MIIMGLWLLGRKWYCFSIIVLSELLVMGNKRFFGGLIEVNW